MTLFLLRKSRKNLSQMLCLRQKFLKCRLKIKIQQLFLCRPDQLSLAIGKDGRNVRLAANLTGWKIDIKTADIPEEEAEGEVKEETEEKEAEEKPKKAKKAKKEKPIEDTDEEIVDGGIVEENPPPKLTTRQQKKTRIKSNRRKII